jgi:hypothetical protein
MHPEYKQLWPCLSEIVGVLDSELRLPCVPSAIGRKTRAVVDIPDAAETDECCASGWSRALVADPRQDIGAIDEVGVSAEWNSERGLALLLYIFCERGLAVDIPGFHCKGLSTLCRDFRGMQRSAVDS